MTWISPWKRPPRGGEREIPITRSEKCAPCAGSGAKPGTKPKPCPDCVGTGQTQHAKTSKGVHMVTLTTCSRCHGRGQLIEAPCTTCQGNGYEFVTHRLKVQIPPGVNDGMMIRLARQGEPNANGGPPGDLLIRPHLRPHPSFDRHGDDLYLVKRVTFPEAALGSEISVTGLGGETLRVTVPSGTQSGTALRLSGKGMPRLEGKGKGDLFVVAEVRTPTDLTPRQRKLLEEFAMPGKLTDLSKVESVTAKRNLS